MKKIKHVLIPLLVSLVLFGCDTVKSKEPTEVIAPALGLYNCIVIDGTGADPQENRVILIKNGVIEDMIYGGSEDIPAGYKKLDLEGQMVLPGFINSHVHCLYSEAALKNWLQNGVTTVRELVSREGVDFGEVRDRLNADNMNARLAVATPGVARKGGYKPPFAAYIESPEEAAEKINGFLKLDPDVIKIAIEDDLQGQQWTLLTLEDIKSITQTAHEGNKRVAAHVSHARNLPLALAGGVDEISHMVVEPVEESIIKEVVNKGIYWVPTLELWHSVSKEYGLDWDQTAKKNLSMFYEAGGKIAMGTDYGGYTVPFEGGMPMTELRLMKEAGMSNMDIILSATRNAAYVCGMEEELGTLEKGKTADLIVVKGNPLESLEALQELQMVIHNGVIVKE